jgi:hypothetical protein
MNRARLRLAELLHVMDEKDLRTRRLIRTAPTVETTRRGGKELAPQVMQAQQ